MNRLAIGITLSQQNDFREYKLNKDYSETVWAAGGLPLVLPIPSDRSDLRDYIGEHIKKIDGLLLSGGLDIDPLTWGKIRCLGLEVLTRRGINLKLLYLRRL